MGDNLVPGYRFYPTEEELLTFYLRNKLENRREDMKQVIPVADVYSFDPWQLPPISGEPCKRDREQWFFFCPRQEREANGGRMTRTTPSGYWKATGSPCFVYSSGNKVMGVKKTMVFYQGRAPTGSKTKWKMNEYRALVEGAYSAGLILENAASKLRSEFSLCRIYTHSGCARSFDRRPSAEASDALQPVAAAAAAMESAPMHETERRVVDHGKSGLNNCKRTRSGGSSDSSDHGDGSWRSIRQRGEEGEGEEEEDHGGVLKMIEFEDNDWNLLDWF